MKQNERRDQVLLDLGANGFTAQDMAIMRKVSRLAKRHTRLAEMFCNGEGWIGGKHYTLGTPDRGEVSGLIGDDDNIFSVEMEKIENKIQALFPDHNNIQVEFHNDPRGETVQLYYVISPTFEIYISDLF